jgi:ATP-dependent 26S proteasome regulatory subunit
VANDPFSIAEFGASFKGFLDQVTQQAPVKEPVFVARFRSHFGADPTRLPLVMETFQNTEHANLQLAIEERLSREDTTSEATGVGNAQPWGPLTIPILLSAAGHYGPPPEEGPVQYRNVALQDRVLPCLEQGVLFVRTPAPIVVLVRGPTEMGWRNQITVEVMAAERTQAEAFLSELRAGMHRRNVYRGRILSLSLDDQHQLCVNFHKLPQIAREQIVLPAGLLERIERQAVDFARHAEQLRAAGRHLRRGLLLHGKPGSGKTLTATYLAGRMPGRTVLLITGRGAGLVEQVCEMARMLEPATVILEDVDLIAEDRARQHPACMPILFELLNQMDGLAEDSDVLFALTTNRPEVLEPALAARPGRIDLAIEVPLPDADGRRRLFSLYAQGLRVAVPFDPWVRRTEGVSGAFIRELLRKAALYAADDRGELEIREKHLDEALHELIVSGGALTRSLLGATEVLPQS